RARRAGARTAPRSSCRTPTPPPGPASRPTRCRRTPLPPPARPGGFGLSLAAWARPESASSDPRPSRREESRGPLSSLGLREEPAPSHVRLGRGHVAGPELRVLRETAIPGVGAPRVEAAPTRPGGRRRYLSGDARQAAARRVEAGSRGEQPLGVGVE